MRFSSRLTPLVSGVIFLFVSLATTIALAATARPADPALPRGYWTLAQTQPILDKTLVVRLAPDLSALSPAEAAAVRKLLEAGRVLQNVYEDAEHHQAAQARRDLIALRKRLGSTIETRNLDDLYRLSSGPIATTLDNRRVPFMPVDSLEPGKCFYPTGATKDEIARFVEAHPERRASILGDRTVVRRTEAAALRADLATLAKHPALDVLHPRLGDDLRALAKQPAAHGFYAVPYPVAYADSFMTVYRLLDQAALAVEPADPAFAGYLRLRARDLLANDYEGGDAAWVTRRFGKLDAQIGAYENYDDELFGVKASHALSLLLEDESRTTAVRGAIKGLQDIENSLPYPAHKQVREDIPVGVYDVIADFGQARGTNTATILPNESDLARRYGRKILLRRNIMTHPGIVASARRAWDAAMDPVHRADFDPDGSFHRTLWHELGHYLGPDRDRQGRDLDQALQEHSSTFEEMKADLVSLFAGRALRAGGYYDDTSLRGLYASGVLRMLNKSRPRPDQSYSVMQLMQLNWFLERGAITCDRKTNRLTIHYDKYPEAVASLLEQVLAIQWNGDHDAASRFIARWTTWDERHEAIARAMKASETSRFRLVRYAALGE